MTAQRCCVCGKHKKKLCSLVKGCEIVGKTAGEYLCQVHKHELKDFLHLIGKENAPVKVRYDDIMRKFFLVPASASSSPGSSPEPTPFTAHTETTHLSLPKALLTALINRLPCQVCGFLAVRMAETCSATADLDAVQLECGECHYAFALTAHGQDNRVVHTPPKSPVHSLAHTSPSSSAYPSSNDEARRSSGETEKRTVRQGLSIHSLTHTEDAADQQPASAPQQPIRKEEVLEMLGRSNADPHDDEPLSPQLAASALLSLERLSPPFIKVSPDSASGETSPSRVKPVRTRKRKRSTAEDQERLMLIQQGEEKVLKRRRIEEEQGIPGISSFAPPTAFPSMLDRLPTFEDLAVTIGNLTPYGPALTPST